MVAVGDQASCEASLVEYAGSDAIIAVMEAAHGVEEVGREAGASVDAGGEVLRVGGVSDRDAGSRGLELGGGLDGACSRGREGDEAQRACGGFEQGLDSLGARVQEVLRVVRALDLEEGALDVQAEGASAWAVIAPAPGGDGSDLLKELVEGRGDEGREEGCGAARPERVRAAASA